MSELFDEWLGGWLIKGIYTCLKIPATTDRAGSFLADMYVQDNSIHLSNLQFALLAYSLTHIRNNLHVASLDIFQPNVDLEIHCIHPIPSLDHQSSNPLTHSSPKLPSPKSTFPTLQISFSSSRSSFDSPNPPCPPSASLLSLACAPSRSATRLK